MNSGAVGFALIIVPSLDRVIYKMSGNNGQYDAMLHGLAQPAPDHLRDEWRPIPRQILGDAPGGLDCGT